MLNVFEAIHKFQKQRFKNSKSLQTKFKFSDLLIGDPSIWSSKQKFKSIKMELSSSLLRGETFQKAMNALSTEQKRCWNISWKDKERIYNSFIEKLVKNLNNPFFDTSLLENSIFEFANSFLDLLSPKFVENLFDEHPLRKMNLNFHHWHTANFRKFQQFKSQQNRVLHSLINLEQYRKESWKFKWKDKHSIFTLEGLNMIATFNYIDCQKVFICFGASGTSQMKLPFNPHTFHNCSENKVLISKPIMGEYLRKGKTILYEEDTPQKKIIQVEDNKLLNMYHKVPFGPAILQTKKKKSYMLLQQTVSHQAKDQNHKKNAKICSL